MTVSLVSKTRRSSVRLSATDAFFVAYQLHSGLLMQLGGEIELYGELHSHHLEQTIDYLVARWPRLGQTVQQSLFGLKWKGECLTEKMLRFGESRAALSAWRNEPIDPFHEPPFQVLWISNGRYNTVAFRAHHAALDGESFVAVTAAAVRFLVQRQSAQQSTQPLSDWSRSGNLISLRKQIRLNDLPGMWRYARWLAAEARAQRSARLAMEATAVGDTQTCEHKLKPDAFAQLRQRARALGVSPIWLCAAAWMRAIYLWNVHRGTTTNAQISLEFPVSLRRILQKDRKHEGALLGNFISPLILFGHATQPLERLAVDLRKQLLQGIRSQSHLALPLFTAPGKFLPWPLFRRIAINPQTTGFATSHFTWFEQSPVYADITRLSDGALRLTSQGIYTPVCLHMGAALAVLASSDHAQIFLTYRVSALSSTAAEDLLRLMIEELQIGKQSELPARTVSAGS